VDEVRRPPGGVPRQGKYRPIFMDIGREAGLFLKKAF
jgi:hypothetical protein